MLVFNLCIHVREVCLWHLWSVYGENSDKLVSGVRVASVQECGADVLGSICHLYAQKEEEFYSNLCLLRLDYCNLQYLM